MREFLLVIHFIGLGLGLGTGFAMMTLGMATKDMALPERGAFFLRAFALSKMGHIGLGLLILSGVGLIFANGMDITFAAGKHFFIAKLCLVGVLAGIIGYLGVLIKKAKAEKGGPVMAKIPKVGSLALLSTLIIVILAVLSFH